MTKVELVARALAASRTG